MQEKRLTTRLTKYWERLKKDGPLPLYAWWNPSSIDDIWPNCVTIIAETAPSGKRYRYQYVGNKIENAWGADISGKPISNGGHHMFKGADIINKLNHVSDIHEPIIDAGKFISEQNKVVKYRSCLLPFGSDGEGVTHVVIGLSWKDF